MLSKLDSMGPFSTDKQRQDMKEAMLLKEMRRMLRAVPDIEDASVVVASSHRRPTWSQKTKVTATVSVKPRGGRELSPKLVHDTTVNIAAPFIATGARPTVAILREQGVNSHIETAWAMHQAGFTAVDVHMSDLIAGRAKLDDFKGLIAVGGFSYGDVLGAGEGWAKTIRFNPQLAEMFATFFGRADTFALGICNGCQMMSSLASMIPGAEAWPKFTRNKSEKFEARFSMVEVQPSPSIFFDGMEGSRIPVAVAHGEGFADFSQQGDASRAAVAMRYVDNRGQATEQYPFNPNGSPQGITSVTTPDGRFTVLMPHMERVHRTATMSWHPEGWGDASPWMRVFQNARRWLG